MPLEGENFKRNNKLVFQILKLGSIKSDAWTWIQLTIVLVLLWQESMAGAGCAL